MRPTTDSPSIRKWFRVPENGVFGKLFCVGFMFSEDMAEVALIRKAKPEWQKGRLNGVGGKLEPGETPGGAMRREFREEAGVDFQSWEPLARLDFPCGDFDGRSLDDATVWFFWAGSPAMRACRTRTEEGIEFHSVAGLPSREDLLPNINWLIPMALSFGKGERANCFMVKEVYGGL